MQGLINNPGGPFKIASIVYLASPTWSESPFFLMTPFVTGNIDTVCACVRVCVCVWPHKQYLKTPHNIPPQSSDLICTGEHTHTHTQQHYLHRTTSPKARQAAIT